MWPLPRRVRLEPDPPRKRPHEAHETYQLPSVYLITPDDGHRRCPKHVEFRDKINFGYLMHLVGYFILNKHIVCCLESTSVPPWWDFTWHQLPSCLIPTWPSTTSAGYCQRTNVLDLPPKKSPLSFRLCTTCSSVHWTSVPYPNRTTEKSTTIERTINRGHHIQLITNADTRLITIRKWQGCIQT
jgi:hypothetical protein